MLTKDMHPTVVAILLLWNCRCLKAAGIPAAQTTHVLKMWVQASWQSLYVQNTAAPEDRPQFGCNVLCRRCIYAAATGSK